MGKRALKIRLGLSQEVPIITPLWLTSLLATSSLGGHDNPPLPPNDCQSSPTSPQSRESGSAAASRGRSFRFNAATDILLLRETVFRNPYAMSHGNVLSCWMEISTTINAVGGRTTWRSCRDRVNRLLDQYKREDRESLRRSGTEEECEEKEQLLHDMLELKEEAEEGRMDTQATRRESQAQEQQAVLDIRGAAVNTLSQTTSVSSGNSDSASRSLPRRSRRRRAPSLEFELQLIRDAEDRRRLEAENRLEELRLRQAELEMERQDRRRTWEMLERLLSDAVHRKIE